MQTCIYDFFILLLYFCTPSILKPPIMTESAPSIRRFNFSKTTPTITRLAFFSVVVWFCLQANLVASAGNRLKLSYTPPPCPSMFSLKTGLWTDPTVWSCNRLPNAGDDIIVSLGHAVTIPANTTALANTVRQRGVLTFGSPNALLLLGFSVNANLVAYYPFNGNANDESGNNHNGTVNGATLTTDRFGNADKAYNFNGSSWIKVDQTNDLQVNDFTLSAWVYLLSDSPLTNMILSNPAYGADRNAWTYSFRDGSTILESQISDPGNYLHNSVSSATIVNNWHHVVYTKSATSASILVDGVLLGGHTISATTGYVNPRGVLIGADDDQGSDGIADRWFFNGKLDDIRIYNRGLTEAEVQRLYESEAPINLTTGLVAYYPFNGNANDESGNTHNGAVNGATLTTDRFGNTDKAYTFNGTNSIKVEQATDFQFDDFTLSAWVYLGSDATQTNMILANPSNVVDDNTWTYAFTAGGSQIEASIYPRNYLYVPVIPASIINSWHHVVYVKSGTTAKVLLDGIVLGTHAVAAVTTYNNPRSILIGADDDALNDGLADRWFFHGKLDDIRIYNRGLSYSEIQTLTNDH